MFTLNFKVSYKNSSHDPFLLHVPGCDFIACNLDQFIDVVKPILLKNWYDECYEHNKDNLLIYFGRFFGF